jgi:hypothetical protein
LSGSNTLARSENLLVMDKKSFIILGPGACIIKLFTAVINSVVQYASAFAIVSHILLALTNALAFYVTELIMVVISFMIQAPGANVIKLFCP